ncbi:MAG: hypothetical protein ACXWC9_08220, partial [Pseudobdellovibrionaceae bacterium]
MILKYVLLAISALAPSRESALISKKVANEMKKVVREEILYIGYRLFFGIVLTSAIVFSLLQLGHATNQALDQLENGLTIKLLVFSLVSVVGSIAMYFFFNSTGFRLKTPPPPVQQTGFLDLQAIALRFAEGFMDGVNQQAPMDKSKS